MLNIFEKIEMGTLSGLGLIHFVSNNGMIQALAVLGVVLTVLVAQAIKAQMARYGYRK